MYVVTTRLFVGMSPHLQENSDSRSSASPSDSLAYFKVSTVPAFSPSLTNVSAHERMRAIGQ